ncbi:FAD-binding oxidoreductase [Modestobacter sp. NPDC049651]|uniref:FAD-binding oxidoreductase n=1 Tax=unclassified Modestobacter TaxID=2643866 RepID=UPI0033FF0036
MNTDLNALRTAVGSTLRGAVRTVRGATAADGPAVPAPAPVPAAERSGGDLLDELAAELTGELARPGDPGYAAATPWNVAVPRAPRAVVLAADDRDVARTVRFAARHGLQVAVHATGHGAVPLPDDVLLLHTGRLDECTVHPAGRWARVGAGVRWGTVIEAAAPHGLAPLAGSAPHVGVVGYLTGGGVGPLVRSHGLSSDTVRAFEVVTGDGELRRVTPDEHPDLFFGLRGGKATLGIVTAVEIDLPEVASFTGGALFFDGADAAAVLHAWADWGRTLPEHASTSVALQQLPPLPQVPPPLAGRLTVAVRYASVADPAVAEAALAPMRAAAPVLIDAVGELPYAEIGRVHSDPVDPMPVHEDAALLRELPAEAVDRLLALAGPGSGSPQIIVELRLLGGAYARPPAHRDAFSHRSAAYTLAVIGVPAPPVAEQVAAHAGQVVAALEPWSTGGLMPNFAATADPALVDRRYDPDTLHWLRELAGQYDPAGVLRVGQVVRP